MSGRLVINLCAFLAILPVSIACPETCQCKPEGRGKRVTCQGGKLSTIMADLPHNTARLIINGVESVTTLAETDFGQMATDSILQLTITNSMLQEVAPSTFAMAFSSLLELDLSANGIRTIHPDSFTKLSDLRVLNLSNNTIDDLGSMLDPLVSLQRLDLSNNFIVDLQPHTFKALTSLSSLRLDGNKLRSLHGTPFQPLAFLAELRVRNCDLFFVSDDFFSAVTRISLLDVGDNKLTRFPSSTAFSDLRQLKFLYLDGNNLQALLPSQFLDLSLVTLSLARNRLRRITGDSLMGLMVEKLDLSENKLLSLERESLKPIASHLATLNIANNGIRVLQPDTFEDLRLLETLNISACSLTVLPAKLLSGLHSLRKLDASWNHLQNISADLIKVFQRLSVINLHKNSWRCDCHITDFRDWMRSRSSYHKLYCLPGRHTQDCADLKCVAPDELVGHRIVNLADSDLKQCGAGGAEASLSAPIQIAIVLACLLFSLGMLLLTVYLWRRRIEDLVFRRKRKPPSDDDLEEEENEKIDPFEDCDNESLKESHRSFVFRHYFDQMVTDPKLLEPTSPSQIGPSEGAGFTQKDSLYSSNPSLYETSHNSHSVVVGIESAV